MTPIEIFDALRYTALGICIGLMLSMILDHLTKEKDD